MTIRKLKAFIEGHYEGLILSAVLCGTLAIALLVRYKFSFLNFFFLPVILGGYYLGKRKGLLLATLCVLLVALYFVFEENIFGGTLNLSFDELINIITWGIFLILTGGILGAAAEQREKKIQNMKRAYTGVLAVLLKYLEVADEKETRSVRIARLAGHMAERAGLDRRDVENVKSAALLYEVGDLSSSLALFAEVASFVELAKGKGSGLTDKEEVLLNTTASLIKDIAPLLEGYFQHYVRDSESTDKFLAGIPFGSSLIALAELYDRIMTQGSARLGHLEIRSVQDLQALKGRVFSEQALRVLPGGQT
jgi:hypothetical protein